MEAELASLVEDGSRVLGQVLAGLVDEEVARHCSFLALQRMEEERIDHQSAQELGACEREVRPGREVKDEDLSPVHHLPKVDQFLLVPYPEAEAYNIKFQKLTEAP